MTGWTGYLSSVPNKEKQTEWVKRYGDHGIGLLTGGQPIPAHILVGLDADDDRLVRPLEKFLTAREVILSGKKGKKGVTFFVLVPEADRVKSTIFRGTEGLGNIDVLAGGKQTVMPPTIHPETKEPYTHIHTPLLDAAFEDLPVIGAQELSALKVAVGSEHILSIMEGAGTHDPGLALVAQLVTAGIPDEVVEAIFVAFFPDDYSGNTLEELPGWIESAAPKASTSPKGGGRDNHTAAVVALCQQSGAELFNDGHGVAYATIPGAGGSRTVAVTSSDFRLWLRYQAHISFEKPLASSNPINEAVLVLEGIALFEGQSEPGQQPGWRKHGQGGNRPRPSRRSRRVHNGRRLVRPGIPPSTSW